MDLEVGRHGLVDRAQEAQELLMAVARPALGEDAALEQIESREQRRGAVAAIVVGHPLDVAEAMGSNGCVRSRGWLPAPTSVVGAERHACTWLFSSTHRTSALSGGFR